VHEPTRSARGAAHLLRRRHRLAERRSVPAEGFCGGRDRATGKEELQRDAVGGAAADVQQGGLARRVAARLEAGEQRRRSGATRTEHGSEDDRERRCDCNAGRQSGRRRTLPPGAQELCVPWFVKGFGRGVHALTVEGAPNRALTAG